MVETTMRRHVLGALVLVVVIGGVIIGGERLLRPARDESGGRIVRVAAAADLKFALDEAAAAFNARRPDVRVEATYAASGNLFGQISNGAPFDLFLSADVDFPKRLVASGLAAEASLFIYAIGHLAIWVRNESTIDVAKLGLRSLVHPAATRVAIANPKVAPYGRAARAAIESAGLMAEVEPRLVYGENVAQTAQFVQSGNAEIGIIALALALSPGARAGGRHWQIPLEAYPRMEQAGLILSRSTDPEAAGAFRGFLTSPEGRALFERSGFIVPKDH